MVCSGKNFPQLSCIPVPFVVHFTRRVALLGETRPYTGREGEGFTMTASTRRDNAAYVLGRKKNENKEVPPVSKELLERAKEVARKYGIGTDKRGK